MSAPKGETCELQNLRKLASGCRRGCRMDASEVPPPIKNRRAHGAATAPRANPNLGEYKLEAPRCQLPVAEAACPALDMSLP